MQSQESKWTQTKISTYDANRAKKFYGESKPFTSLQQLVSSTIREFLDNLETKEKRS